MPASIDTVTLNWDALPGLLVAVAIMLGSVFMWRRERREPPLFPSKEFNRPFWEWQRTNPAARKLHLVGRLLGVSALSLAIIVFALDFIGVNFLPAL